MALVTPVIFQIVGFQNSGKTTISTKILDLLSSKGYKVVSIKHHGHGGKPEIIEQKDSSMHVQFGAMASIVEGEGRLLLQAEQDTWTLKEKIHLMNYFNPDLILIEGYKREKYPKLLILKDEKDQKELADLENVRYIFVWNEWLKRQITETLHIPCFQIDDEVGIKEIVNDLEEKICSIN